MEYHEVPETQAKLLARLSRGCVGWALKALKEPSVLEHRQTEMERVVSLMDGGLEQRFSAASDVSTIYYRDRAAAMTSIHTWLQWWRDLLLVKEGSDADIYNLDCIEALKEKAAPYSSAEISTFLTAILDALKAIEANVQPRLALEALMLRMPPARQQPSPKA
jgi:DNA polymerase-3 subunit delta'